MTRPIQVVESPGLPEVPLPKGWPEHVGSAVVAVVALACHAMTVVRSWGLDSPGHRVRLEGEIDLLRSEVGMLQEELRIKDARMARIEPRRRSHYTPSERLAILELQAARGWNIAQSARRMLLSPPTIASWHHRVDEQGPGALARPNEPVNRFPDFVTHTVQTLKLLFPMLGKRRIAEILARAGLHLAVSTVMRMLARDHVPGPPATPTPPPSHTCDADAGNADSDSWEPSTTANPSAPAPAQRPARSVVARHPGHVWGADITGVATSGGFWVPWEPGSKPLAWPFCWWLVVVVDHFSRQALAIETFRTLPTAADVCVLLERCAAKHGAPKYMVTDQGVQFQTDYLAWCERHGVTARFGKVHRHGSVALVERFNLSLKTEAFADLRTVPMQEAAMRARMVTYERWFNELRPHRSLGGSTPAEIVALHPRAAGAQSANASASSSAVAKPDPPCAAELLANRAPRFEPRARYPSAAPCAAPRVVALRGRPGDKLALVVERMPDAPHLPIVSLRLAA